MHHGKGFQPPLLMCLRMCESRTILVHSRPFSSILVILVPRAHDPSGLWQGSRALAGPGAGRAGPNFLSMRRVFVSNSQPIRFARFDNKSVNRGLPVLDQTRALDPCHRPEGSWALGTRMHSRPQSLRSFWPAAGIESNGSNHYERTKEITEFCPSGLTQSSSMAHARNGCSQSSRFLPQARRIVGSGDENALLLVNTKNRDFWLGPTTFQF